jgi:hypothetical protein
MAVDPFRDSPDIVAVMSLLSNMELIHLQVVGSMPRCSAALSIASNEVLLKAPLKGSYSYLLVFHSILYACYYIVQCTFSRFPSFVGKLVSVLVLSFITPCLVRLSTNFSIVFNKKDDRLIGQYALASV